MDLLHVVTESKKVAEDVVQFLLSNKLVLDALVTEGQTYKSLKKKGPTNVTLIQARTKHFLFNSIDQKLRKRYGKEMPLLYSVPIVNMDWEQAQELVSQTAKT